ncbi:DEAD-box helicase Dbp80-like [Topomyia yanbarensis]|uniref:DEAD-box helicase Dbp80-like n=1 Tax=Topomyia yanbarensis TaxID=2498891 RepID=UPI00273CA0CE|nr:DEAD-box helicase Dbp80-like [Topomyia yanbarensis]
MEFAEYIVPNPIVIRLAREKESLDNIKQYYVKCRNQDEKLCDYRRTSDHFLSYDVRKTAGWLTGRMSQDGHSVAVLSGDLTVEQRLDALYEFRTGLQKVQIIMNVLSRGKFRHLILATAPGYREILSPYVSTSNRGPLSSTSTCRWISRDEPIAKRIYIELDTPVDSNGITINLVDSNRSIMICRSIEKHFRKDSVASRGDLGRK